VDTPLRLLVQKVGGAVTGSAARNLKKEEAHEAFTMLLDGAGDPVQVAAFLVAMRSKGMTGDELVGFATAARERIPFPVLPDGAVVLSTARMGKYLHPELGMAGVAAAVGAGVAVLVQAAPHARGSGVTLGDMWQRMVGDICTDAKTVESQFSSAGLACWQPTCGDAGWLRLLEVENHLGLRCAPDIVSKLLVPDDSRVMVPSRLGPVLGLASDALCSLGHRWGLILQGCEGSLDPYLCQRTRGMWLEDGNKSPLRESPEDYGIFCPNEPEHGVVDRYESSHVAVMKALAGVDGPEMDCAALGGALIIRLSGVVPDMATALGMARDSLESGAAHRAIKA